MTNAVRYDHSADVLDVLIVGAGPVGLFLANECQRRGLRWRLVEARSTQSEHSKALAIFPRTLEILDMAGLVKPFMAAANPVTSVSVIAHGRTLARMPFAPGESPYPLIAMVPQNVTEQLLVAQLQQRGGVVEYATSFVTAVEHDDVVTVTLDTNGERRQVRAAFVVGCDGAHSAIRHLLKLPFEGAQYDDLFMLADIETNEALPPDQLQLCPSEFGPLAIFPMSPTRRRVVATVRSVASDAAPSLELVRHLLAERAPAGLEARALHWSSYFHIHHRHVGQLRSGRIFIAGDAAHIHSPFGGQGMNTGLHDVWNLVWKLDLVLHGHGGERLLDSYGAERLPVIAQVIETTHRLTTVMGTPSRFAQLLRDVAIPMVSRLAPFQHAFVQRLSELGVNYQGSPIVEGGGERYFDPSLGGGDGIRSRFLLICDDTVGPALKAAANQLAAGFDQILELRWRTDGKITLVRPDGYVAYAAPSRDGVAAFDAVRSALERQTETVPALMAGAKTLDASV